MRCKCSCYKILRHLSWFLSQPLLLLYLKSYILPSFDYCDVIWSGCTRDEPLCWETLLNFACRTVLHRHRDYSASAARSELGLSTLSARRKLYLAQTIFKRLPPSLLLIFLYFSLHQPLTVTLVPLLLVNLICLLQELSVLLVLPCGGLFQKILELVQTLEHFQDFERLSYHEQCSLLTIQNITSIIT